MNYLLETPKLKFFATRGSFYTFWTERGRSLRKWEARLCPLLQVQIEIR
jgi:hypothetical protein